MARDRRIRVLHVIPYIGHGGAERQLTELAKHFDRTRYSLTIAYYSPDDRLRGELESAGVRLVRLPKGGRGSPLLVQALVRLILRRRPHIVHSWVFAANVWGRLAAAMCGVPVIIAYELGCDPGKPLLHRLVERALARIGHCIMVNNWPAAELSMRTQRLPREMFWLVENGADLARFDSATESDGREWRRAMGIPEDTFLFGIVARMTAEKGHAVLWRALAALASSGQPTRLLVVGDGPMKFRLRATARRMGIDDAVTFAGARDDIPVVMKAIDCLVIPSLREGLPNVALEAMASRRPVIATDVGACARAVADGETGWIVPPSDPTALAAAMTEAAADPQRARRRGEAGRARVEQQFRVEHMVAAMDRVYRELLAARGVGARRLGYVASRFPRLSETFVLREANALERLGWRVAPFSLTTPRAIDWSHAAAERWRGRVQMPDLWLYLSLAWAHLVGLLTQPRAYATTLAAIICQVGWRRFDSLVRHLAAFAIGVGLVERIKRLGWVHAHFAWVSATAAWAAARLAGVHYSVTVHGSDVQRRRLVDELLVTKLAEARFIVCVSDAIRKQVEALLRGRAMPPIRVIRTGVGRRSLEEPRQPSPGALKTTRLLAVGRLAPEKGHRHLLAAVRFLRDQTIDVRLDIIGEGSEYNRLLADVADLELGRAVSLCGAMSEQEIWDRYRRADIFVLPSLREGLPVALLEAMAAGLPVIASDLPGVREAVGDERSALLVRPGNATALAEAISRLIVDPEERARLAGAARQVVEERFLLDENIRELAALFEEEAALCCGPGCGGVDGAAS